MQVLTARESMQTSTSFLLFLRLLAPDFGDTFMGKAVSLVVPDTGELYNGVTGMKGFPRWSR